MTTQANQKIIKAEDGKEYVITKLNAVDQIDLLINLGGLMGNSGLFGSDENNTNAVISSLLKSIVSITKESRQQFLECALSNVYLKDQNGVFPVYDNGTCLYDDMDWADLVGLIGANIKFNFGNFSQAQKKIARLTGLSIIDSLNIQIEPMAGKNRKANVKI